jgi:hypothetical protein
MSSVNLRKRKHPKTSYDAFVEVLADTSNRFAAKNHAGAIFQRACEADVEVAKRAHLFLYSLQTSHERANRSVDGRDGKGFDRYDVEEASKIAERIIAGVDLSQRVESGLLHFVSKYRDQIVKYCDGPVLRYIFNGGDPVPVSIASLFDEDVVQEDIEEEDDDADEEDSYDGSFIDDEDDDDDDDDGEDGGEAAVGGVRKTDVLSAPGVQCTPFGYRGVLTLSLNANSMFEDALADLNYNPEKILKRMRCAGLTLIDTYAQLMVRAPQDQDACLVDAGSTVTVFFNNEFITGVVLEVKKVARDVMVKMNEDWYPLQQNMWFQNFSV